MPERTWVWYDNGTRTPDQVGGDEIDACTFRILTPAEVLGVMVFPSEYRIRGAKRDRVRVAGNAVTPPAAQLIGERILAALAASWRAPSGSQT